MNRKIIAITLVLGLFAAAATACNVEFGVENRNGLNSAQDINKAISTSGISQIDIDISYGNVEVKTIEGNECTVDIKGTNKYILDTKVEAVSNVISIKDINSSRRTFGNNNFQDRKVSIGIPKEYKDDIEIKFDAGKLVVKEINTNNLNISNSAGEVIIEDIQFSNLDYNQDAGSTRIDLKRKCGNIDANNSAGYVTINYAEVGGNLDFRCDMGGGNITIPENSPVKVNSTADLGKVDVIAKTSSESKYTFNLKVSMGEIIVK